jgi:hypothetical protein
MLTTVKDKRECWRKWQNAWRKKHHNRWKETEIKWSKSASGIYTEFNNRRPKLVNITREDFIEWYNQQEQKCFYCGRTLEQIQKDKTQRRKNIRRFEIDRINSNKSYEIGNMVLACNNCNSVKNNFFTKDEMLKIVKMFPYKFK